ncbi:ABC-type transport auxiliary lipoprotein family protein [Terasakiella sp. A23]|uniref:ABC-type transport auxiliary lipoprotein family protein n=1 Tax=Terasakiella sp. FCG-A23 TaxID=3080561 RepID=UPI002955647F|nr:ABC-type transport auxiliary lipoprotein family protein [Terasakiella sp. A23]MDV7339984.1 ABC-type transport auxiliary lipoprotein family protein [Terasakiella sp. A23]
MKATFLKSISFGAVALGLAACAQPELPQDNYYRLAVTPPAAGNTLFDGVVEVDRFRADGLISGRPIAYTEGKGHLSEYHYHFWVEPPVDLLQDAMVKFLRGANVAKHIVTPELRMDEDYLLTGKIKRLERDLADGKNIAVEIEIGLKRTSDDQILVLKTYNRVLAQSARGVNGAVQAINGALAEIFNEFLTDVRS